MLPGNSSWSIMKRSIQESTKSSDPHDEDGEQIVNSTNDNEGEEETESTISPMDFKIAPSAEALRPAADLDFFPNCNDGSNQVEDTASQFLSDLSISPPEQKRCSASTMSTPDRDANLNTARTEDNFVSMTPSAYTQSLDTSQKIISLTDNDVLFGRGQRSNNHPGNKRFRQLVLDNRVRYESHGTSKKKKNAVSIEILETVYAYGGRFMEIVEGSSPERYIEVERSRARKKCSQRLREASR